MVRHALVLSAVAFLAAPIMGQVTNWTGATGTSWNDATNWDNGVPDALTDAVIPAVVNQPSPTAVNPVTKNLSIDAGATLTLGLGKDLTVNGALTINGSLTVTSSASDIAVTGSWTNNGAFAHGSARVDLGGTGTLGGTITTTFQNLDITGGSRTATGAFVVDGDVTVMGATTSLDIGSFTQIVSGSWISTDVGTTITGTGPIEFIGSGALFTAANTIPSVRVSAGLRAVFTSAIAGDLEMTGGQIQIDDNDTLSVSGNATLSAGILGWTSLGSNTVAEILDVDGDVTITGATVGTTSAEVILRCGGNWSSNSGFAPALGTFELDGGTVATVSGTSPIFPSLRVVSGTKSVAAASAIGGDLTVENGATLDTSASLSVAGNVSLGDATAAWVVGAVSHTIVGDLMSAGANASGAGTLEFTGTGNLASTGPTMTVANVLVSGGTRSMFGVTISGNLDMTGGGVALFDNALITVTGNATLAAGTLSFLDSSAGLEVLDVLGNVDISATALVTSVSTSIECAGDWTSSAAFVPALGTVTLDGGSIANVAGSNFPNLVVASGAKTFTIGSAVSGDLNVATGATIDTAAGVVNIAGGVSLGDATSGWALGLLTHTVGGSYTAIGASATGTGTIELTGGGTLFTGGGSIANLDITGGAYLAFETDIVGNLGMTAGSLEIQDDQIVTVGGNANLVGGTVGWTFSPLGVEDVLDVAGDATVTAATGSSSPNTRFFVGGNWSSALPFALPLGVVELDGVGVTTIGGASPNFPNLVIPSGSKSVLSLMAVATDLTLSSGASLANGADVTVGGQVTLGDATAAWDLGTSTVTVAGDWTSAGASATGTGNVTFTAGGTVDTGTGSIANVVSTGGLRSLGATSISGNLDMTGGIIRINNDVVVSVGGDANLTAGSLEFFGFATGIEDVLDIQGNAAITATSGPTSSLTLMRVAGNWSSSAAYAPASGLIELDGGTIATIAGTGPTFANLTVVSGSKTLGSTAAVTGDLTVDAASTLTLSLADISVAGNVLVNGSLDMGGQQATVVADWTSDAIGASVVGPGIIEFTGTGQLSTAANSVPQVLISGGTRTVIDSIITGDLDMTAGTLTVWEATTLAVGGNATLSAGTLTFIDTGAALEVIDVAGNVTIAAASGLDSADTRIFCAGDWSSDASYLPLATTVVLDGGSIASVSGTSPNLANLQIASGTKTILVPAVLSGDLVVDIGAALVSGADLSVDTDVTLGDATASWDLGVFTHSITGNWTSAGASATGAGVVDFVGSGIVDAGGGTISNVRCSAGTRTFALADVSGNLELLGGVLRIGDDGLLTVGGNADLLAGTLEWFGFLLGVEDVLDVQGDATVTATAGAATSLSRFRVAGNWSSSSAFAPGAGVVELDGGTTTTVSGAAPVLADLRVVSGTKTLSVDTHVTGDLQVDSGAQLISGAILDIDGAVTLGDATASWDIGVFTHTVGGSFTSAGASATGAGAVDFDGAGSLLTTAPAVIDNVIVSAGTRSMLDTQITGNLDMTGGGVDIQDDATVTVGGNASFLSGTLSFTGGVPGAETIDVAGDVTMTCASGTTSADSTILCAGSWSANGTYAPGLGSVTLDGVPTTSITGLLPDQVVAFSALTLSNGIRQVGNDITLLLANMTVDAGAELQVGAQAVTVPGSQIVVDGTLSIDAGGDLSLGSTAVLSVTSTGTLRVLGVTGTPATVSGVAGGGYFLTIAGTVEASHFVFQEMGASGIVINSSALLGAPPNDLRAGVFDLPSSTPGSTLLNISRSTPTEIRYITFKNTGGTGTFNASTVVPGAVTTFANASGGFAGAANEFDPLTLIDWTVDATILSAFTATPALLQVTVDWTTSLEVDSVQFIVDRATSIVGPFTNIAVLPSLGPSSYQVVDTAVVAGQKYFYRISELLTHGDTRLVDQREATPWGPDLPLNVLDVGVAGTFADIQSAINAAVTPASIVMVEPGTYGAFTITPGFPGTLRVYGDGTGPVIIDTSSQPVQILNLGVSDIVELIDLQIGSVGSPNPAMLVQNSLGVVVLDKLAIQGGSGLEGIRINSSDRVAIQRCDTAGTPGLVLEVGSTAVAGLGTLSDLELRDLSDLRTAGLTYTSTVQPGSTLTVLPGVHADLDLPAFVVLDQPFNITMSGEPNGFWFLILALDMVWVEWPGTQFEMVNLADFGLFGIIGSGPLGPAGSLTFPVIVPPDAALLGIPIVMQQVVVHPTSLQRRWSSVQTFVSMPQ